MGGIAKSLSCQFVPGLWVTTDIFLSLDYIEGWQTQTIEFFFWSPWIWYVCLEVQESGLPRALPHDEPLLPSPIPVSKKIIIRPLEPLYQDISSDRNIL